MSKAKDTAALPAALNAARHEIDGSAGRLSYYVAGEGPPMLLVHSINAAASAYEVRPIFEWAIQHHKVYAVDLPGFGFSDRSQRAYTPRLYTDAIHDMLEMIAGDGNGDATDRCTRHLARQRVPGARRHRAARPLPHPYSRDADRISEGRREIARCGRARRARCRASTVLHLSAVEPGHLRSLGQQAEHSLFPAQDVRLGQLRSRACGLRLSHRASAWRQERALRLRVGTAVQQGYPRRSTNSSRCRCGCRTAPRAISAISARPTGQCRGRIGGWSPSIPARCRISSGRKNSW